MGDGACALAYVGVAEVRLKEDPGQNVWPGREFWRVAYQILETVTCFAIEAFTCEEDN